MTRILVNAPDYMLDEINGQLEDACICFDFDSDRRYMVDDDDTTEAVSIIEGVGAEADII